MYAEPLNNFSSTELMHYTSHQTSTENVSTINPDYINNLDFNIYSQTSDINSDFLENELFNPLTQIGRHAQLVNQQENVTNYSDNITLNNHTDHLVENLNNIHYTNQDQSDFVTASPHGYSENNITTPLLEPYNGVYSVQNTPLLPINQLLFSPVVNTSPAALSDFLFEDIGSTTCSDFGTPYTTTVPLITPNTPYINTPYVTSSPFSVASSTINTPFAFPLLDTPIGTNADPDLYDESTSKNSHWFSLFGSSNGFTKRPYEENNNFYSYQAINTMTSISPKNIETFEKKIDPSSPKSHHSEGSTPIPSDKTTSLAESPTPVIENSITISMSEAMVDNSKVIDNNTSGIMETIKSETINTHLSDSTPTTPVDSSKLVPIRPRPLDDDDTAENDSTRRSKRQRTMSVSEENEEDNDDETEKKYNCPECGRGFNRKFNMQTHRATHDPNRVKPFACEHPNCGSRFTRKHDLKRHINGIHKGEKVHECTVCRKPFSRKDAWKRHIATCGKM